MKGAIQYSDPYYKDPYSLASLRPLLFTWLTFTNGFAKLQGPYSEKPPGRKTETVFKEHLRPHASATADGAKFLTVWAPRTCPRPAI